jgi:hypothetical protein
MRDNDTAQHVCVCWPQRITRCKKHEHELCQSELVLNRNHVRKWNYRAAIELCSGGASFESRSTHDLSRGSFSPCRQISV